MYLLHNIKTTQSYFALLILGEWNYVFRMSKGENYMPLITVFNGPSAGLQSQVTCPAVCKSSKIYWLKLGKLFMKDNYC